MQSSELETILGTPRGSFVYATLLVRQVRLNDPPQYGQAVALASLTLVLIAFIIPLQRWILTRRRYTTVSGSFRPGLVDLGRWKWPAFAFVISDHVITVFTLLVLIAGSFMTRIGYFNIDPVFTLLHWKFVLAAPLFLTGLRTTLILAMASGILSPLLFALIAYTLVRTRWRFRIVLDGIIWTSGAIPGMLTGLGLLLMFLWTPGLSFLFGSIGALIIVVVLQGNTTGVNLIKGNIVQIGYDMEDASRVSGAGWLRTFFTIWLRLMAPVLVLIGLFNFNIAANTTASIILLASRETTTLSLVILEWLLGIVDRRGPAGVVQIILGSITFFTALGARQLALRLGLRHQ